MLGCRKAAKTPPSRVNRALLPARKAFRPAPLSGPRVDSTADPSLEDNSRTASPNPLQEIEPAESQTGAADRWARPSHGAGQRPGLARLVFLTRRRPKFEVGSGGVHRPQHGDQCRGLCGERSAISRSICSGGRPAAIASRTRTIICASAGSTGVEFGSGDGDSGSVIAMARRPRRFALQIPTAPADSSAIAPEFKRAALSKHPISLKSCPGTPPSPRTDPTGGWACLA